ncbi:MAG: LolA-related protein [Pseudomonadales bacterium]
MTNVVYGLTTWLACALFYGASTASMAADTLISATDPEPARVVLRGLQFPVEQPVAFSEQQFNPMLKKPIVSRGQVWLEADGTMVMQLQSPTVEQRRLLGDRLSLIRAAGTDQNGRPDAGIERHLKLNPKRSTHVVLLAANAVLSGEHGWLQQQFALSLNKPEPTANATQAWELLLVPIDAELRHQLSWIQLMGNASELRSLRADRGRKGWQQLEFHSPKL